MSHKISTGQIPDPNKGIPTQELVDRLRAKIRGLKTLSECLDALHRQDYILSVEAIFQEFPKTTNAQLCKAMGYPDLG